MFIGVLVLIFIVFESSKRRVGLEDLVITVGFIDVRVARP